VAISSHSKAECKIARGSKDLTSQ